MKSLWQSRKSLGYAYKNYKYLLRKNRYRKKRNKDTSSLFSDPKSYSPTVPVERPNMDTQVNFLETSYEAEPESPERDPEIIFEGQESRMRRNSLPSVCTTETYQPYFAASPLHSSPSHRPCFHSPDTHNYPDIFAPTEPASPVSEGVLTQADPGPLHDPEMMPYPTGLEHQGLGHAGPSFYMPAPFATSSPIRNNPGILNNFPEDPSTWTVDEVIQFLIQSDPQTLTPIVDLFREHEIDGKALLLLKSDMMLKYMGLKLGTAVKLSHYIDGLKGENYMDN